MQRSNLLRKKVPLNQEMAINFACIVQKPVLTLTIRGLLFASGRDPDGISSIVALHSSDLTHSRSSPARPVSVPSQ